MKIIADGVALLDLAVKMGEHETVLHPTVVWDDKDVVLVDTGVPGLLPAIREEMERVGIPFERLSKIVLTHQDYDHIGGVPAILEASERPIEVLAHKEDKPYIEGDKLMIKHNPSRGEPPTAKVDSVLEDGQVLPVLGGLTVIFTPGHTPGHISLYHAKSKTLITGDAIVSSDGKLLGPNEAFTPDLDLAWKSIARFTDYDVTNALCFHGGVCDEHVNEQFRSLVNR